MDRKVATTYLPMKREYIRSNDSCVKQRALLWLESNIQWPTILIEWFTFPSESINCTKLIFSLISIIISKASFFLHIVRLYIRFCSPFIFLLFYIIALAKWILLLRFSFSRVNYSSILFTRAVISLLSLI